MMKRLFAIALLAAIPSFLATPAAKADNLVLNQWYTAQFGDTWPTPVSGGNVYGDGTDGPVLPGGFANSIDAPSGTSWQITLTGSGTLTATDLEASGDQFQLYDNSVLMSAAASPFTAPGQNPGWASPGSGETSVPIDGPYVSADINALLGNGEFSSGTFELDPGVNVITIEYLGVDSTGDMSFIAESSTPPVPEPSSLILFGSGLAGFLVTLRRKIKA